jgi:uncharacterized tellurite resistance protein B-like protein
LHRNQKKEIFMFKIFESEEKKAVKSHLRQMVGLANADGHFHTEEIKFILKVAKKNDIPRKEVDEIIENPSNIELHIPEDPSERFEQLFDLVNLMIKDGQVTDAELDFCQEIAAKLGYRKVIVGILVEKIERGIEQGMTRKKIKKECAPFINY